MTSFRAVVINLKLERSFENWKVVAQVANSLPSTPATLKLAGFSTGRSAKGKRTFLLILSWKLHNTQKQRGHKLTCRPKSPNGHPGYSGEGARALGSRLVNYPNNSGQRAAAGADGVCRLMGFSDLSRQVTADSNSSNAFIILLLPIHFHF